MKREEIMGLDMIPYFMFLSLTAARQSFPWNKRMPSAIEEKLWQEQLHEAVEMALAELPEQSAEIMRLRYYQGLTAAEAGELSGVGRDGVRRIESKAIRQLRKPSVACHLRPFYDFDFYCGTGLGAFQHTGMSIQERYLVIEEERKEKAEQQRLDRERRRREKKNRIAFEESMERTRQQAEELVSRMTPEEKARLLAEYGYVRT